jgi:hypothetical protein
MPRDQMNTALAPTAAYRNYAVMVRMKDTIAGCMTKLNG